MTVAEVLLSVLIAAPVGGGAAWLYGRVWLKKNKAKMKAVVQEEFFTANRRAMHDAKRKTMPRQDSGKPARITKPGGGHRG